MSIPQSYIDAATEEVENAKPLYTNINGETREWLLKKNINRK